MACSENCQHDSFTAVFTVILHVNASGEMSSKQSVYPVASSLGLQTLVLWSFQY